ncbi:fra a 1-associated protein [Ziziphus jujuba]|uniref:Uncharacterized protein LOC107433619 n=2 Tax=Ziziphus jujuba TaxID=326968 RepID=A0A6P4AWW8_ZIZJJ|nr:fra a 1-associated protein [Ziziphus jujuba]KAH7512275.1 hypothetical protein FEM48_Zijuj12G0073400 [Ziziphus jujuba var. spinosa]
MGWLWKDKSEDAVTSPDNAVTSPESDVSTDQNPNTSNLEYRSKTVWKSKCRTEEVEPGKFVMKCVNSKDITSYRCGRLVKVNSNVEHTEEDVTEQVLKGSLSTGPRPVQINESEYVFTGPLCRLVGAAKEIKDRIFG